MNGTDEAKTTGANWLRSPIWLVLFSIVLASLVAGSVLGRPLFKLGPGKPTIALKEYRDDDLGFSLKYPGNWHKLSPEELAKSQGAFAFAIRRSNPDAFFSVKTQEVKSRHVDLKQVAGALDNAMPKNFKDFKKIAQSIIDINGNRALKYDYVFSAGPRVIVREELTIISTQKKVFHLTAWSSTTDFGRVRPDFDQITGSFTTQ
ncbi:MAG: hypothetical protein Q8L35_08015 [Actinomycetota bacterium]|nr:hypothetical protein [Actinomycetota bacterium]